MSHPAHQPPTANPETVKMLFDLAVKRHDLGERSFDTMNTRLAALLGFNGFLLPTLGANIRTLMTPPTAGGIGYHPRVGQWLVIVWLISLVAAAFLCAWGYLAQAVLTLPDAASMYEAHAGSLPQIIAAEGLSSLDKAWKILRDATRKKGRALNWAIRLLAVQVAVAALAYFYSVR